MKIIPIKSGKSEQKNSNSNKKKDVKCYTCQRIGHITTECRSKTLGENNKFNSTKGNKVCHICKKPGHFAKFSRAAIKNTPNSTSTVANVVSLNVLTLQDDITGDTYTEA